MKEKYHVPSRNLQIMQHKTSKKASRVLTFEPKSVIRILVSVHFFLEQVFVLCKGAMRAL